MVNWNEAIKVNGRTVNAIDLGRLGKQVKDDPIVSQIVGKPVKVNDPRLLKLVVQWKQKNENSETSDKMDNFINDPHFRQALINTFNANTSQEEKS